MGNPIVHWELMSKDPAKVSDFYAKIFGWKVRAYLDSRHVCDGGDVGCSFRRISRSNMSILQGLPTTRCAQIAPSLRVAARTARGGRSSACALGVGATPQRAKRAEFNPRAHCTPPRSHPRRRGPCSTLRRAGRIPASGARRGAEEGPSGI
jgi:hypothetical protein